MEIILKPVEEGMMFKGEAAEQMKALIKKGTFGFGAFECTDLDVTYKELSAKGVAFTKPPTREFYGYAAVFADDSGNWFSLSEKPKD